ncbi:MAG TPA: EscT/YscT/HrcT family type III secretion system export apparatus protein, partial [Polyangia bacterium]|nr:EscT/YscT/HrcT family type III secretion system export apparatus protein [Polyangia bacterium]
MLSSARLSVGTLWCRVRGGVLGGVGGLAGVVGLLALALGALPACNRANPLYHPGGLPSGAAGAGGAQGAAGDQGAA